MSGDKNRKMILRKLGGSYQLLIRNFDDLKKVVELDEAHWAVTDAPCESFCCDKKFLAYLDSDKNGRIRSDELKNAIEWTFKMLSGTDLAGNEDDFITLDSINGEEAEGKLIKEAAELVLTNLGAEDGTRISLAQLLDRSKIVSADTLNGDGVIPIQAAGNDKQIVQFLKDIMESQGSVPDASGEQGINGALLEKFMAETVDFVNWFKEGESAEDGKESAVLIWGAETAAAYDSMEKVRDKIDEYFTLCRLTKIEKNVECRFQMTPEQFADFDISDPAKVSELIKKRPLNKPSADETLHIDRNINPAFADGISEFSKLVLEKAALLDTSSLSAEKWEEIKKLFLPYAAWKSGRKSTSIEKIPVDRLKKYASGKYAEKLRVLIEKDLSVADELQHIDSLEKLILFRKHLPEFINNFVSLRDLFIPGRPSMIQAGRLVMDGRHFDLTMKVSSRNEHKKTAGRCNICIMYLSLKRKNGTAEENMEVAAAVTSGLISNLYIGKAGVFFTPDGREWDAGIVDFIQQPVSISEAIRMPFIKIGEFIGKQAERFKTSRYAEFESNLDKSITQGEKSLAASPPAKPAPAASGAWQSGSMLMLGGGIGLAALGSAFAFMVKALKNVSIWQVIAVIIGILIIIILPAVIIAFFKLRKRNIGMFLEAAGWSVNPPLRLSYKMGLIFTHVPACPENSSRKRGEETKSFFKNIALEPGHLKRRFAFIIALIIIILCLLVWIFMEFRGMENVKKLFRCNKKTAIEKTAPAVKTENPENKAQK